jgi:hypothetical protein
MTLPAEVDRVVTRYLALVDAAAPGVVEGLYLVGSVALDDFHPRASDVDFIAVPTARRTRLARCTMTGSSRSGPAAGRRSSGPRSRGTGSRSGGPAPLSSPCEQRPRRIAGGWARRWADGVATNRRPTLSKPTQRAITSLSSSRWPLR